MNCSRRDLVYLLPAAAAAQEKKAAAPKPKLPSKVYVYEQLAVREQGQNKQRAVLNGLLHGGFALESHLTELGPGQEPHGQHRHSHEEMVLLQTGSLDVTTTSPPNRITASASVQRMSTSAIVAALSASLPAKARFPLFIASSA